MKLQKIRRLRDITVNTLVIYWNSRIRYYNQFSLSYYFKFYGKESLGATGCGPFACAIVTSTLLNRKIDPVEVAKWSYDNGFYENGHGSFHSLIPTYCKMQGLHCEDLGNRVDELERHLQNDGGLGIVLCKRGSFSRGDHFVVVGMEKENFKVYNSANVLDCYRKFDIKVIHNALKTENIFIGPIWYISKDE